MKVLFVCTANIGRSQMAEAFFKRLSPENEVRSAGVIGEEYKEVKLGEKDPELVRAMKELGYDISENYPKGLTPELVSWADKIIVMTTPDIPDYVKNSPKTLYWDVTDPAHKDYISKVKARDQIENLVKELTSEL